VTLIHGIPGMEDELKAHLLSLAAPTRAEPGCITYDLYQSPTRRHEFMRFEVWRSSAALDAHKQTPPLKASFERRQREGWTTEIILWRPVGGTP
jgi:quinol monooxygenase YgiN